MQLHQETFKHISDSSNKTEILIPYCHGCCHAKTTYCTRNDTNSTSLSITTGIR